MPAQSQAQRAYLYMKFGSAWVKAHHFDNAGKLPAHVSHSRRIAAKRKARHAG
jgi:hypothetical protein